MDSFNSSQSSYDANAQNLANITKIIPKAAQVGSIVNVKVVTPSPTSGITANIPNDQVYPILPSEVEKLFSDLSKAMVEIAALKTLIANLKLQTTTVNETKTFTFIQSIESLEWIIPHNKNNTSLIYLLVDKFGFQIIPDQFIIADGNKVLIRFTKPQSGTVNLLFF